MEQEVTSRAIKMTDLLPTFHIISLSLLTLMIFTLFILGLKKSDLKFQWLLSSCTIWIGLFGGISLTYFWFKIWRVVYFVGDPIQKYWALDQLGAYFRFCVYLSLALASWTLSIALKLIVDKKNANQQVDLTVKTPVESGKAQGTQGHV